MSLKWFSLTASTVRQSTRELISSRRDSPSPGLGPLAPLGRGEWRWAWTGQTVPQHNQPMWERKENLNKGGRFLLKERGEDVVQANTQNKNRCAEHTLFYFTIICKVVFVSWMQVIHFPLEGRVHLLLLFDPLINTILLISNIYWAHTVTLCWVSYVHYVISSADV